jgi:hypothetical protein
MAKQVCPVCSNPKLERKPKGYSLCTSCHVLFLATNKQANYFNDYYRQDFVSHRAQQVLFRLFSILDVCIHPLSYWHKYQAVRSTHQLLDKSKKPILEIGFGNGSALAKLLASGHNAYGIEQSHTALANFRKKYPEYARRVSTKPQHKKYSTIISNAVFEHIAEPDTFLQSVGTLGDNILFNFPLLTDWNNRRLASDINVWPPEHVRLYSKRSLEKLINQNNLKLRQLIVYRDFSCVVLSTMYQHGLKEYEYIRVPFISQRKTKIPLWKFITFLVEALFRTYGTSNCTMILSKTI